ncbi:MAG: chemotaxis protein CheA [Thermodesulfovibrio sp.]|nr:chemotaxis protein CheA [Thermodesulfovibrio sp.]
MKASKKEFIAEAEELLEESQRLILEVQDTYQSGLNPDTINALFRAMHTLKGVSGLFGVQGITTLSHALETLMDDVRLGKIEVTDGVVNFLFKNLDILKDITERVSQDSDEGDIATYLREIEVFRESLKGQVEGDSPLSLIDPSIMKVLSEYEEHRLKANLKDGKGIFLVKAVFPLETFDTSLEALTKKVKAGGELISTLPTSENVPDGSIGFNLMFSSVGQVEELQQALGYPLDMLVKPRAAKPVPVVVVESAAEAAVTTPQKPQDTHLKSTSTTVRVDIEKLDRILNTVGELTLAKGAVKRIGTELVELYGHNTLVYDIHKISQTLERRLAELQDQVLEIRMVPIGQIFTRLAQIVRRYSREVDKQIDLVLYGEDTELDKYLAEEIVDPLMHLIRNSIDHGIEHAEDRRKKGKKESGTVILRAYQKGNHVVIELKDDGAGIDVDKVRKKAIEKGLIQEGAVLTEKEVIDFIFAPGFSTKDVVSDISGRGVGMDVVKEKLSVLGGYAEVETKKDAGTTFMLTLPITLAIIKALIVRVGDERFAVPLTSMSETLIVEHKDIQTIEWKEVYYLRGEMLPMIRVSTFFKFPPLPTERSFAVVVGFGERKVGLLVDELYGQQEIVIKSLGEYLKKMRGFAGAAEIGKHEVILVLDIESLIDDSVVKLKGGAIYV